LLIGPEGSPSHGQRTAPASGAQLPNQISQTKFPCQSSKANVPKRKFPSEGFQTKASKWQLPSERSQTKIPKTQLPKRSSQPNIPRRRFPNEKKLKRRAHTLGARIRSPKRQTKIDFLLNLATATEHSFLQTEHKTTLHCSRACICSVGNAIRTIMTLSRDNCHRALRATGTEHGYIG
jgi:hypothetical protein